MEGYYIFAIAHSNRALHKFLIQLSWLKRCHLYDNNLAYFLVVERIIAVFIRKPPIIGPGGNFYFRTSYPKC